MDTIAVIMISRVARLATFVVFILIHFHNTTTTHSLLHGTTSKLYAYSKKQHQPPMFRSIISLVNYSLKRSCRACTERCFSARSSANVDSTGATQLTHSKDQYSDCPFTTLDWVTINKINDDRNSGINTAANKIRFNDYGNIAISTFNMLAPCYKRLMTRDPITGRRIRESSEEEQWRARAKSTLDFFRREMYGCDIISLQEFWLDEKYSDMFVNEFREEGFELKLLQRSGEKKDAVGFAIKSASLQIKQHKYVYLCHQNDRVALLLWLSHRHTDKNILVASTHLSFPHNVFDRMNQMRQMQNLTEAIDKFKKDNKLEHATNIILGDFNVESKSPVCDHLKDSGYYSCFEVSPPDRGGQAGLAASPARPFVSHRTHRNEDLGVDHIFYKPEYEYDAAGGRGLAGNVYNDRTIYNKDRPSGESDLCCDGGVFASSSQVLPLSLPCDAWPENFTISDHRPIKTTLVFMKEQRGV